MFVVTEADAAAIRAVSQQRGEFAAAVELRQHIGSRMEGNPPVHTVIVSSRQGFS
jgi:hypothetical protein